MAPIHWSWKKKQNIAVNAAWSWNYFILLWNSIINRNTIFLLTSSSGTVAQRTMWWGLLKSQILAWQFSALTAIMITPTPLFCLFIFLDSWCGHLFWTMVGVIIKLVKVLEIWMENEVRVRVGNKKRIYELKPNHQQPIIF